MINTITLSGTMTLTHWWNPNSFAVDKWSGGGVVNFV